MNLADLSLDRWRSTDLVAARAVARQAADRAGGRVSAVETVEHLGAPLHRVRIERDGQEFALVPGGAVTLGFDLDAWQPTPGQVADYRESLEQGFGYGPDLRAHLAQLLSPRRTVTLAAVLMAVEDENLTEPPADMPALLAERGLRMPTSDEWEHACGVGRGDAVPVGRRVPARPHPLRGRRWAPAPAERLRSAHRVRRLPHRTEQRRRRRPRRGRR